MVEQIFGVLFVLAVTLTPAAVVAGVALLAWPRRSKTHDVSIGHGASAHA